MNNRQEKPPLKCLLGIDPEKAQNASLRNVLLAAGKRQKPHGGGST